MFMRNFRKFSLQPNGLLGGVCGGRRQVGWWLLLREARRLLAGRGDASLFGGEALLPLAALLNTRAISS